MKFNFDYKIEELHLNNFKGDHDKFLRKSFGTAVAEQVEQMVSFQQKKIPSVEYWKSDERQFSTDIILLTNEHWEFIKQMLETLKMSSSFSGCQIIDEIKNEIEYK